MKLSLTTNNRFSTLEIESDDEKYEEKKNIEQKEYEEKRMKKLQEKRIKREEKEREKEKEYIKHQENEYLKNLKRTKVYDGLIPLQYVKLIEEDHYDISNYLSLSREIQCSLSISNMGCALAYGGFQIFNKEEYLYLVEIMEKAKNSWYYNPEKQLKDMMSISEERMMKCYFSGIDKSVGYEFAAIYQIYKFLLWDTHNYRKLLKDEIYSILKQTIDNDIKDFIENPYNMHSKIEQEYVLKYFELGKRYYAKRNNFKILFRNYLKVIGKFMILYKKL